MSGLHGTCALVTGGSRGIGRGIALRLADRDARVAINYLRDEAAAMQTLQAIRDRGAQGFVVRADVSQPDDVAAMAAEQCPRQPARLLRTAAHCLDGAVE
jgi:NAD(P)-dependent dehydrogenase (short-subunit alcohol dehydrogenase family)